MNCSSVKSFGSIAPFKSQQQFVKRAAQMQVYAQSVTAATNRQTWIPGVPVPKHLDGEFPGDYGFDPLNLAANETRYAYFREAELYNGRWAMAGVAGIIGQELLGRGDFWDAGARVGSGPFSYTQLTIVEILTVGVFEYFRYKAWKNKGTMSGIGNQFPFDPIGLGKSADTQLKEVKNARLAMIAFFGFLVQHWVTGKSPIQNLTDHIADPWNQNIYTSRIGAEFTAFAIFFAIIPTAIYAKQVLAKDDPEILEPVQFGFLLAPFAAIVLAIHVTVGQLYT